jgi:hypothetical protein
MKIPMDKTLREIAEQAYETAGLGRNGVQTTQDLVSAEMLANLEASGDAMRFVDGPDCLEGDAQPFPIPQGP